jgi:hypothetical protein
MSFPFEIMGALLPWSIALAVLILPGPRMRLMQAISSDSFLRLAAAVSIWSVALFWIMPGAKGRYLLPAYPFMAILIAHTLEGLTKTAQGVTNGFTGILFFRMERAFVRRRIGWILLILLWGIGILIAGKSAASIPVWQPLAAGLAVVTMTGFSVQKETRYLVFSLFLLFALLYGIFYTGVSSVRKAEKERHFVESAQQIAASIDDYLPIVCDQDVSYRDCFIISRESGRLVQRSHPSQQGYFLVTSLNHGKELYGLPKTQAPPLGLWRVTPWESSDTVSAQGPSQ